MKANMYPCCGRVQLIQGGSCNDRFPGKAGGIVLPLGLTPRVINDTERNLVTRFIDRDVTLPLTTAL